MRFLHGTEALRTFIEVHRDLGVLLFGGYRARAADESWAYYPSYNEILSVDFTSERTAVARTKLRIQDRIYTDILSLISLNGAWGIIAKVAASEPIKD